MKLYGDFVSATNTTIIIKPLLNRLLFEMLLTVRHRRLGFSDFNVRI